MWKLYGNRNNIEIILKQNTLKQNTSVLRDYLIATDYNESKPEKQ